MSTKLAWLLLVAGLGVAVLAFRAPPSPSAAPAPGEAPRAASGPAGARTAGGAPAAEAADSCAGCHRARQPGLLAGWDESAHAAEHVRCEDCHGSDHDQIFADEGRVPAARCSRCHEKQTREFLASTHARARADALGNARLIAQIPAMQRQGCMGCHDIGGGEDGQCNACHGAHRHSAADARRPEACGTCHMGPDHPHIEAWEASPHGVAYGATHDSRQAPTCATCHMPRGTHDVSAGLTLGKAGSGAVLEGDVAPIPMHVLTKAEAEAGRAIMLERCTACHTKRMAQTALEDADAIKREADRLVGKAASLVRALSEEGRLHPAPAERAAHPTAGHRLVLGGGMLYENQSEAERIFFDLAKFAHAITFKAAYHQASDHMHWLGIARLKARIVELEAEARRLRKE